MGTDEGGAASAQREELAETTLTPCPLAKKGREAAGSIRTCIYQSGAAARPVIIARAIIHAAAKATRATNVHGHWGEARVRRVRPTARALVSDAGYIRNAWVAKRARYDEAAAAACDASSARRRRRALRGEAAGGAGDWRGGASRARHAAVAGHARAGRAGAADGARRRHIGEVAGGAGAGRAGAAARRAV